MTYKKIFHSDLFRTLDIWDKIILIMDANEYIFDGNIPKAKAFKMGNPAGCPLI